MAHAEPITGTIAARSDRTVHDLRPIQIETQVNRYAEGSALIRMGHTHVLCAATVEDSVPKWLEKQQPGHGWITAEYSMLPRSTHTRSRRDREKMTGRTHEIQRLIGRALRGIIDLRALGPRTVTLDCDVLQADGGTRTAAINGACVALTLALKKTAPQAIRGLVSAVSVGFVPSASGSELRVDLDYVEDSGCHVDMNVVMLENGNLIEIQGTAEKDAFTAQQLQQMIASATQAISKIQAIQRKCL